MLRYYAKKSYNEEPKEVKTLPFERAWIYGSRVVESEVKQLAEIFSLDGDILKDVYDDNELPRIEFSKGALYVFIRAPKRVAHGAVITVPFLAVITGTVLITLSSKEYATPQEVFSNTSLGMKNLHYVFLQVINRVIGQYESHIHETGKYIRNTENRLHTHEVDNHDFINFVTVEHDLNEYRTNLTAIEALLTRLCENRHDLFSSEDCEFVEDMGLHVNQLLVTTRSHLSTVESIRNAYTTISNNTLNQRMKRLTLLTLLIALPNVFFGMYGMNVQLPFATQPWAYAAVVSTSLLVVIAAAWIAKKTKF